MTGAAMNAGTIFASFAGSAQEAAATMAVFAGASALIAIGLGQPQQAASFAAAALMYGVLAGTSEKKNKEKMKPQIASQGLSAPTTSGGDINVQIVMSEGVIIGKADEIGEQIVKSIAGAKYGNARIPRQLIA
jgi:hypothetical protein